MSQGTTTDPVKELYDWANDLETRANTASENGLFEDQNQVTYDQVLQPLKDAFKVLAPYLLATNQNPATPLTAGQYTDVRGWIDASARLLDRAYNSLGRWERVANVYGFFAWVYLMGVIFLVMLIVRNVFPWIHVDSKFMTVPVQSILFGVLGGILQAGWSLWYHVNRREYRKVWATWFLLAPVMGAMLGGVVYLIFYVGLVSTSTSADFSKPEALFLVAFLAGFSWQWAAGLLEKITKDLGAPAEKGA